MTQTSIKKVARCLLSLLLTLLFIGAFASVTFAAEKLTASANVQSWPTLSYKTADGKMYYGQTLEEALQINDDEVVLNAAGEQVAGHFEIRSPEKIPNPGTGLKLDITFVPDDTNAYTSFSKLRSTLVYDVQAVELVPVDENSATPIATAIEAGSLLSTSILSGGEMTNPYNPNEPKLISTEWIWSPSINEPSRTIVSESGYYTAQFAPAGYTPLYAQVYVEVLADFEIAEYPTIPELTYDANITWADIELTGGKAVVKGTDTEVAGKFAIKDTRLSVTPNTYFTEIEIVFTPDDPEAALPYEFRIPVTVNPCPISFGSDKKGISIDDPYIFEVAPFADMGEVRDILKYYHLNWPGSTGVQIEDYNGTAEHGRIYEYYVREYSNSNYTGNIAYVKLVFATTEITPSIVRAGSNKFKVDCAGHSVPGTFTIYHNDVEIATVSRKDGYVFDCEVYTDEGGTSHIKAVYNPVENDYYVCNDAETTITVAPMHTITNAKGTSSHPINIKVNGSGDDSGRTGSTVEMRATLDSFVCWIIKDADGKEVTLDGVDVNSKSITFLMPDCDLLVTYKTQADLDREEAIANCDHLCHSDNELIRLFWNIINMFFRLLNVQQYCDCGEMHYSAPLFPIA